MPRTRGSSVAVKAERGFGRAVLPVIFEVNAVQFAVGGCGTFDKPVIHLAHTQDFLDHLAGITFAQLYLFGKEFGAANFYGVGI